MEVEKSLPFVPPLHPLVYACLVKKRRDCRQRYPSSLPVREFWRPIEDFIASTSLICPSLACRQFSEEGKTLGIRMFLADLEKQWVRCSNYSLKKHPVLFSFIATQLSPQECEKLIKESYREACVEESGMRNLNCQQDLQVTENRISNSYRCLMSETRKKMKAFVCKDRNSIQASQIDLTWKKFFVVRVLEQLLPAFFATGLLNVFFIPPSPFNVRPKLDKLDCTNFHLVPEKLHVKSAISTLTDQKEQLKFHYKRPRTAISSGIQKYCKKARIEVLEGKGKTIEDKTLQKPSKLKFLRTSFDSPPSVGCTLNSSGFQKFEMNVGDELRFCFRFDDSEQKTLPHVFFITSNISSSLRGEEESSTSILPEEMGEFVLLPQGINCCPSRGLDRFPTSMFLSGLSHMAEWRDSVEETMQSILPKVLIAVTLLYILDCKEVFERLEFFETKRSVKDEIQSHFDSLKKENRFRFDDAKIQTEQEKVKGEKKMEEEIGILSDHLDYIYRPEEVEEFRKSLQSFFSSEGFWTPIQDALSVQFCGPVNEIMPFYRWKNTGDPEARSEVLSLAIQLSRYLVKLIHRTDDIEENQVLFIHLLTRHSPELAERVVHMLYKKEKNFRFPQYGLSHIGWDLIKYNLVKEKPQWDTPLREIYSLYFRTLVEIRFSIRDSEIKKLREREILFRTTHGNIINNNKSVTSLSFRAHRPGIDTYSVQAHLERRAISTIDLIVNNKNVVAVSHCIKPPAEFKFIWSPKQI